ncbi:MFS transporter [candidate division KSB1 bacterium]|nr:MFS transporter [candidate division KSB1 bacterium]
MSQDNSYYKWVVLSILFSILMLGFGGMSVIPPLYSEIDKDIGLTLTQLGATVAFFTLASPVFSPIGGVLTDKFGARLVLFIAALIVAAAGAARYFVTGPNQLIALMFVYGVGFACYGPVIPKALSAVFPAKEFGKANGIVWSAIWVGSTLAFFFGVNVLSPFFGGWRMLMIAIGVLSAIAAIIWALVFRDPVAEGDTETGVSQEESGVPQESGFASFLKVVRIGNIWWLSIYYAFCIGALLSILSLLPAVLGDRGLDNPGMLAALMTATLVASSIMGGVLSDRFGRKPVLVVSTIVFALSVPALLVFSGPSFTSVPLLMICLVIAGAAAGPFLPVSTAMPVEMPGIGPLYAGTALGILFMIGNTGGFLGPIITGWLMDTTGSAWSGFLFVALLLLIAPLFLIKLRNFQIPQEAQT